MSTNSDSLCRRGLHKFLSGFTLEGEVLDIGGTKNGKYHQELKGSHNITVANIDEKYGYDVKIDLEKKFTLEDNSFDHILCLNVLEHIYNYQNVLSESHRVLKSGGTMIHFTPFLYKEHGCPHDYFRYSKSALKRMYQDAGFEVVKVEPVVYGVFKCVYQYTNFFLLFKVLKVPYRWIMEILEGFLSGLLKPYERIAKDFVLSYGVVAKKR